MCPRHPFLYMSRMWRRSQDRSWFDNCLAVAWAQGVQEAMDHWGKQREPSMEPVIKWFMDRNSAKFLELNTSAGSGMEGFQDYYFLFWIRYVILCYAVMLLIPFHFGMGQTCDSFVGQKCGFCCKSFASFLEHVLNTYHNHIRIMSKSYQTCIKNRIKNCVKIISKP